MAPPARLRTVVLDCPDPLALAEFYRSLIGGDIRYDEDEPDWVVYEPTGATFRLPASGRLRPAHLAHG